MARDVETEQVTACVVVRDEAPLLSGCLASLGSAMAEIIVVDHRSTDDSARVARDHGASVLRSEAAFHEQARNAYLEAARTEWVLVLDADERLSESGRANVPALVRDAPPGVLGYALERYDYLGEGRWAPTRLVRLFRVDPRIRYFESRAHAAVAPSITDAGGAIALADDASLHHIDALLPRDHAAKRSGMRARLEREIAGGAPAILQCFLALERFAIGDHAAADALLTRAFEEDARCEPIARLFRAQQHLVLGRLEEAEDEARRVLGLAPNPRFRGRASAFVVLADAEARQGRRGAAVATMTAALVETPALASHHLSLAALLERDDAARAREHFQRALIANPWLSSPHIYVSGAPTSIFRQQDGLLACVDRGDHLGRRLGLVESV